MLLSFCTTVHVQQPKRGDVVDRLFGRLADVNAPTRVVNAV